MAFIPPRTIDDFELQNAYPSLHYRPDPAAAAVLRAMPEGEQLYFVAEPGPDGDGSNITITFRDRRIGYMLPDTFRDMVARTLRDDRKDYVAVIPPWSGAPTFGLYIYKRRPEQYAEPYKVYTIKRTGGADRQEAIAQLSPGDFLDLIEKDAGGYDVVAFITDDPVVGFLPEYADDYIGRHIGVHATVEEVRVDKKGILTLYARLTPY